jgi:hypothetical protein
MGSEIEPDIQPTTGEAYHIEILTWQLEIFPEFISYPMVLLLVSQCKVDLRRRVIHGRWYSAACSYVEETGTIHIVLIVVGMK